MAPSRGCGPEDAGLGQAGGAGPGGALISDRRVCLRPGPREVCGGRCSPGFIFPHLHPGIPEAPPLGTSNAPGPPGSGLSSPAQQALFAGLHRHANPGRRGAWGAQKARRGEKVRWPGRGASARAARVGHRIPPGCSWKATGTSERPAPDTREGRISGQQGRAGEQRRAPVLWQSF